MASLARDADGTKRILFTTHGERKTIRLGRVSVKAAEAFKLRVEALLERKGLNQAIEGELAEWVAGLPDETHKRLVRVDLVPERQKAAAPTLGDLLARFEAAATVKRGTWLAYKQGVDSLRKHLGDNAVLAGITAADADVWRKRLVDEGLAPATVAKRVHIARAIFRKAVRWGLLASSPFADLRAGSQSNPDRSHYITPEVVEAVLDQCPSAEWEALVGLSRLAGLRVPSEVALLTWADIDWDKGRMRVRSPKTAGHEGHAVRTVPIVPSLRGILLRLFEAADEGAVLVVPTVRDPSRNFRTHFKRILERAGLTPWPRTFHNMRASCACDWVERFPAHVVASWLGHSPTIAAQHSLQTRDVHFDLAAGLLTREGGAESGALGAQKAAQHGTAAKCAEVQESQEVLAGGDVAHTGAPKSNSGQRCRMGADGFEPS